METLNLTDEQIENWRRIIAYQLETRSPGTGIVATLLKKETILEHVKRMKEILERPEPQPKRPEVYRKTAQKKCTHSNSITGNNGKYCIDCAKYV